MMRTFPALHVELPEWVAHHVASFDHALFSTVENRMRFVISLARENSSRGSGPFAAAIFDQQTHSLIAPGINLVLGSNCSVLHAEIVAIMIAQMVRGSWNLGANGQSPVELVSSTEPCAMCLGAIPWSGISHLVCGARDQDARDVGFDEGAKPRDWKNELSQRGIRTTVDLCRDVAVEALKAYRVAGGVIYNSRS